MKKDNSSVETHTISYKPMGSPLILLLPLSNYTTKEEGREPEQKLKEF